MYRVLTVVSSLGPGGTERAAQNFALGYKAVGHESAVLSYSGGGSRVETLQSSDIPVFVGGKNPKERENAVRKAVNWGYDVIHIHRPGGTDHIWEEVFRSLNAASNIVLETNVFSRVDYSSTRKFIDVHLHLSRWCLWKWSQWKRRTSSEAIGAVIPYMVRSQAFFAATLEEENAFRDSFDIPRDAPLIGRVGQPSEGKWSRHIFDVYTNVYQACPNTHLVLVGLPDTLKPFLFKLPVDIRQNIHSIEFLHGDATLRACYSTLDVFLHIAQIGESFGMVLTEAMMCGCPVVTLSTPLKDNSQVEVVGHQIGGLVAANVNMLTKSTLKMLSEAQPKEKYAKQTRKWVLDRFDTPIVMDKLMRIVHHVKSATGRDDLRTRLIQDSDIITTVSRDDLMEILTNVDGQYSLRDKVGMQIVHQPDLYRLWYTLRRLRWKLR